MNMFYVLVAYAGRVSSRRAAHIPQSGVCWITLAVVLKTNGQEVTII